MRTGEKGQPQGWDFSPLGPGCAYPQCKDTSSPCLKPRCFSRDICSLHIKAGWSAPLLLPCTGRGAQQLLFHPMVCSGPSDTLCSPGFLILLLIPWQSHSLERARLSQPHESSAVRSFKYGTLGEILLKPSSHEECLHGPLPPPHLPSSAVQPLLERAWSCMARAGFTLRSGKSF